MRPGWGVARLAKVPPRRIDVHTRWRQRRRVRDRESWATGVGIRVATRGTLAESE